jgi:hypothetical protein
VKVRSKAPRRVITMWEPNTENASATGVSAPPAHAGTPRIPESANSQLDAIRRLKNSKPPTRRPEKGLSSFKPDAPLDRVSGEEAKNITDGWHD